MRRNLPATCIFSFLIALCTIFSSCLKDSCHHTYKISTPVYTKLSALRASVRSTSPKQINNTGKMFIKGQFIFLNEVNEGVHVIDNTDPAHPVKISFINIPGNADVYITGNTLYADLYCDFLAVDISDPKNIVVKKYLTNTFPERTAYTTSSNPDSINVITGYTSRDTSVACEVSPSYIPIYNGPSFALASSSQTASKGLAGSMARFAAAGNYMYTVSTADLHVINISDAPNPVFVQAKSIGWSIETIFPYNNRLYIGSGNSMSVFDLQNPADPQQMSWVGHWCSSDPVIADNNYAYVTLHEANVCNSKVNQLEVYDLGNASFPNLVKTYPLTRPQGLSKDGYLLFICDGTAGLKVYDASKPADIKLIKQFPGMETYDVIADAGIAYVVSKDGLYQFDYSNRGDIHLLSKLMK